jgi:hypothetical protein
MDESALSDASTVSNAIRSTSGPKDLRQLTHAFLELIPPRLVPTFDKGRDCWVIGNSESNGIDESSFYFELDVESVCGMRSVSA